MSGWAKKVFLEIKSTPVQNSVYIVEVAANVSDYDINLIDKEASGLRTDFYLESSSDDKI